MIVSGAKFTDSVIDYKNSIEDRCISKRHAEIRSESTDLETEGGNKMLSAHQWCHASVLRDLV